MKGLAALLVALVATAATVGAVMAIVAQASSGTQPWGSELFDNFIFVRALPFIVGLGVLFGALGGWLYPRRPAARRADGAVRRFSPATVWLHALVALAFLLALPTGLWQYLGGILDTPGPLPVHIYYRIHYIGAAMLIAAVTAFLVYWWMTGERSLVVGRRDWGRHLRGFALELPPSVGVRLAKILRLDLRQPAGSSGPFTFYEKAFSFPTWGFAIGLITVTGMVKVLRYVVPIPGPVIFIDSTLHVTAMVLLVIRTLDHLRYTLARWPLVVAITTGWLPPRAAAKRSVADGASASTLAEGGS